MKREILIAKPFSGLSGCCPGHDIMTEFLNPEYWALKEILKHK